MSNAVCLLCRDDGLPEDEYRVPPERLMLHMRVEHGDDPRLHVEGCDMDGCSCLEIATWPDGEPVIVDMTLEPDDFRES